MSETTDFTIGHVKVLDLGGDRWLIRYKDSETGADIRRRFKHTTEAKIKEIAAHVYNESLSTKNYIPGKKRHAPTIHDAIGQALRLSRSRDYVRRSDGKQAALFTAWLATEHPAVKTWDQLKPFMLQEYVLELETKGKAYKTIVNRLLPIRKAWRIMNENHPDLVRPLPRITIKRPDRRDEIDCLNAGEVADLLDWLKQHGPDLYPISCLQALAGLRMLEASSLRLQDVDLKAGTITITDTGRHKPKTSDSYRTIPLAKEPLEALRVAIAWEIERPDSGEIFIGRRGEPWTKDSISSRWARALEHITAEPSFKDRGVRGKMPIHPHGLKRPELARVPARKLRSSFATMAARLDVPDRLLKAYIGHTPGDMLGVHYRKITLDDLRVVSKVMNDWRNLIETQKCQECAGPQTETKPKRSENIKK